MKKFIITEEERSRILGIHKKSTSRHYLMEQGVVPPSLTTATTTIGPNPEGTRIDNEYIEKTFGVPLTKEITCSCPELKEYMGKVNQKNPNLTGTFKMIDGDTVEFKLEGNQLFKLTLNVTD